MQTLWFPLIFIFCTQEHLVGLEQGCQTHGMGAGSGPSDGFIRPSREEKKITRMFKKKKKKQSRSWGELCVDVFVCLRNIQNAQFRH